MGVFGLAEKKETKSKKTAGKAKSSAASDEAKAILAKMEAKKEAGDCPFC